MFQNLSTDELKSLSAALITTQRGFSSNRMARMLGNGGALSLANTYSAIAEEILGLYQEVNNLIIASYEAA